MSVRSIMATLSLNDYFFPCMREATSGLTWAKNSK